MKTARIGMWALSGMSLCAAAWGAPVLGDGPKVTVELVPDHCGRYTGGEAFTVHVWLHSHLSADRDLRGVRFDFSDTDDAISLDHAFEFDMSSTSTHPDGWWIHLELPMPWVWFAWDIWSPPGTLLTLPAGGLLHIGTIGVALPSDPREYRLDILNADEPDLKVGGTSMSTGRDERWSARSGEILAGTYDFVVVPEPPTLTLLALGFLLARRRGPCRLGEHLSSLRLTTGT